jgi:hypothetical protein
MREDNSIHKPGKPTATLALTVNLYKVHLFLLITLLLLAYGNFTSGQDPKGKTFIVAPGGSDRNQGTMSQPLATIEAARDAARVTGAGKHRIIIMPGDYYLAKPFELDPRDNGLTIEADTSGKVILYGGTLVTGWRRDGDKFWCADLPGVKEKTWDFRALVVNGRLAERARMPESGTLVHLSVFDVPWLTTVGGGWARKPTQEELTSMRYDPKDIPATLDVNNAEVRVYHMWDESLVGVTSNDIQKHELIFSKPTVSPPGSFGKKDYIIWNTREGMTKPGRWYLDRTAGRLVYWPLEGEDMTRVKVIAPKIEQIFLINGNPDKKAENITICGLSLQATTIPLKSAGFGGSAFDGALNMLNTYKCTIDRLEITNVGGVGISAAQMNDCRISDCHVYNTGACGVRINGSGNSIQRNHIHDAGIYYPSSAGLYIGRCDRTHIYRNEIHDIPYCGMILGGADYLVVEENLIYRVMREIHDGAAIYTSGVDNCILRGNVVRDLKEAGTGYGVSSYYLDEGSHDCLIEQNVSIGVAVPTHNHIALNTILRDNIFIADEDMTLSFPWSSRFTFERNTLITPGRIRITSPYAITSWKGNRIFSDGRGKNNETQPFRIDSTMPIAPKPVHKTKPIEVTRSIKAPSLDGILKSDEWPGAYQRLDRKPSRQMCSGAPVMVKLSNDNKFLYIGAMITMFDINNISKGDKWGKDDGVEISVGGFEKGKPSTFIIRAYVDGTIQSVTDGGATTTAAMRVGKSVRYVSKILDRPGKGWSGEWAIPLDVMGLKPKPDMKASFNICAFVNEYDKWHCWEGTLGENWLVEQAGILQLK